MDELNRYQNSLIESLEQENEKYNEFNKQLDFESIVTKANVYCNKLVNIKKEMQSLSERSDKLKKRALRLQSIKSNQIESIEIEKYKELEKEKRLQPVVVNKSDDQNN